MFVLNSVIIIVETSEGVVFMNFRANIVSVAVGILLAASPVCTSSPSWPLPVGEQIIIQEYEDPYGNGPNGIGNVLVTDSSVWWVIYRHSLPDYWWHLIRYDLLTEAEKEFSFNYRIRQFVVTTDDTNIFYTSWDDPPCVSEEGVDCFFRFDVPVQTSYLVFQRESRYVWHPDIDSNWLVWKELNSSDYAFLMNWQEGPDRFVLLDQGYVLSPRISHPQVAWIASGPGGYYQGVVRNLETGETVTIEPIFRNLDIDNGLLVYPVGEYLLTHLYVLDLNNPEGTPCQISWDNGAEAPRIHNKLVVWDYYDGATGRSAIQGRDLETGLTFDIGVRGGYHSYDVRNHIVAWADRTYYPEAQVFIMLTRPYPLRGDLNGDNVVDISDIMLVASHWRDAEGDPDYDKGWDLNWDGRVDVVDTMLVVRHWGETWPPPTPTPTVTPTATPTPRPSPIPIGGVIVPVNKLELLTPWIRLGLLAFVTVTLLARMGGCSLGRVSESEFDRLPKT